MIFLSFTKRPHFVKIILGSKIALSIRIDGDNGNAEFDFEGTGDEVHGNTNAPSSISYSAIIYSLRALVSTDIPLNQGFSFFPFFKKKINVIIIKELCVLYE